MVSQKLADKNGQSITFKVYPQAHKKASGSNTIYLRVTISRKKREFNLNTSWPIEQFDPVREEAKPRHKNDTDVDSVNMIIRDAKGKANRIRMRYFADEKALSLEQFAKEFETWESRDNFLHFWDEKIKQRRNDGVISEATKTRHLTNLHRFKDFLNEYHFLSMGDIAPELVQRFQSWLRKPTKERGALSHNTVVNAIKCLKTYVRAAMEEGFRITDPFEKIKTKYVAGTREVLDRSELARLKKLMEDDSLNEVMREVLRKFLFSCYTGLRISDSNQVNRKMISNGILKLRPVKGENYGKEILIPLPDYALHLITGRKGLLFEAYTDQTCNQWLKLIAEKAGINKHLSFHVSRDTFATLFIEMGGDVFTLKELMGHSDIKTTMIYVKMSENRKGVLMANFNDL